MQIFTSLRRVAGIALAALTFAQPLSAYAVDYSSVRQAGWEDMCMRGDQPMNFCSSFAGPSSIAYSRELEATLQSISQQINSRYRFSSDSRAYGVSDHWTVPMRGVADCEDYVLAKIMALSEAGYPVSAMRIKTGQLRSGEWHAVLGVKTDNGIITLDSLNGFSNGYRTMFYLDMNNTSSWRVAA
ncbi:transglutaminase-like cysteine peptidase [Devosia sp. MC1541]|uniref:transglutaminase-like cysteine peptidase n=1 Tax=Devosia sp. MC1541 TaxID=2725264 RepID=UPI00145EF720|nr:transglutaminase-like cysteine peptidase [Devosia sp. MC1541]